MIARASFDGLAARQGRRRFPCWRRRPVLRYYAILLAVLFVANVSAVVAGAWLAEWVRP